MLIATPTAEIPRGERAAPPILLLPNRIDHDDVIVGAGGESVSGILLGVEERRLRPVALDFQRHSHLVILGDTECGKTAALRTLCREIVRTNTFEQAQLLIVDYRRSLLGAIESHQVGDYASSSPVLDAVLPKLIDLLRRRMSPAEASQAQLRARSWWSGPDIYVVVDDYDLVALPAGNPLACLLEFLPHAREVGLHLILARRSGGADRAFFEPLLAGLRDLDCMALVMSGRPDESGPFGSSRPAALPAGRGVLIARGDDEQLIQVGWSPP